MNYPEGQADVPALASCAVYVLVIVLILSTVAFILVQSRGG